MNDKEVLTEAEELRRQSSLLSTFEEIAHTSLSLVSGERGNGKVFTSLQDYLDGSVLINGAYCSRRTVLLAIHDMKDKHQAPAALQSKTLSKLDLLNVRPVPQVICYDDIATAILRMEVVIRLEAMQALVELELCLNQSAPGAAGRLAPALGQTPRQPRWTIGVETPLRRADGSMSKLRTIGYGLAAVACCAGAISFLNSGHASDFYTGASDQACGQPCRNDYRHQMVRPGLHFLERRRGHAHQWEDVHGWSVVSLQSSKVSCYRELL